LQLVLHDSKCEPKTNGVIELNATTLSSNGGSSAVSIELVYKSTYANEPRFDSNVTVKDSHFDGEHDYPIALETQGLFLMANELSRICNAIDNFTSQPIESLAGAGFEGEFEFTVLPDQNFVLRFGERDDTISSLNSTLSVIVSSGKFSAQTSFVTDQSCLRIFSQSLRREIADLSV